MSLSSSDHSLPSIPSLPPIDLGSDHPNTSPSGSPSVPSKAASHESFSTALTSSHIDSPTGSDSPPPSPSRLSSSALPQNLRKSISVDSFVHGRDGPQSGSRPRTTRTYTSPNGLDSPAVFPLTATASTSRIPEQPPPVPPPQRLRGHSLSAKAATLLVRRERSDDSVGDSDLERSDRLHSSADSSRRASLKRKEPRPVIRGGELPLPSRVHALSSASSASVPTASSKNGQDGGHPMQKTSSAQPLKRPVNISLGTLPSRPRSGSLGVTNVGRHIVINTDVTMFNSTKQRSEITTLAVVGAASCGKSMIIRKGLKRSALGEPVTLFTSPGSAGCEKPFSYIRRVGRITRDIDSSEQPLHIIEIDAMNIDNISSPTHEGGFWPLGLPPVDAAIICYDVSNEDSFIPVENLLRGCCGLKLPTVVLACKSDLEKKIEPQRALETIKKYDVGLVEVSMQKEGKDKMRRSFDWVLKAVFRPRPTTLSEFDPNYRNPASPDVLISPPWESSGAATPTASSSAASMYTAAQSQHALSPPAISPAPAIVRSSSIPTSPTRARSTSDLKSEHEKLRNMTMERQLDGSRSTTELNAVSPVNGTDEPREEKQVDKEKESRPAQWATLEELLDKLIFLAVSGDDPAFITYFLLTYRRFATPRSVLLAMQKRMRQLDNPSGDPMFACFGQMRICHLLELWIRDYPYDFAVRGTAGALSALIKSIIAKTYLLHYGSDFLPFLEMLPNLTDKDAAWALKAEDPAEESDDSYSIFDDDDGDDDTTGPELDATTPRSSPPGTRSPRSPTLSRERKPSLTLHAKSFVMPNNSPPPYPGNTEISDLSAKQLIKELVKVAQEVNGIDSEEIAQEITRIEARMFLDIEPRHWLQYTFVSGKKEPQTDTIARFNQVSNHLADWVVSLILCHDKPRARAKQIEKLVDIAQKLRTLNNYSALRAFVAGINNATFPGDITMDIFKAKAPEHAKNLQSWDLLLQHIRSHRSYRMALKNTKGACIPALEVHMSDLIRAHEGNPDVNINDPGKVHWGKFNLFGKFISSTTQCQTQCRTTNDYDFTESPHIRELVFRDILMDAEMQKSRIAPPSEADVLEDSYRPNIPLAISRSTHATQPKDAALLRKLFFW